MSFLPPGTFLVDFNIQVTSSLEDTASHEHGGLHGHSKGQQKVNSPSLGQFQPLFIPIIMVQFFLKSSKGNTGFVLDNEGL